LLVYKLVDISTDSRQQKVSSVFEARLWWMEGARNVKLAAQWFCIIRPSSASHQGPKQSGQRRNDGEGHPKLKCNDFAFNLRNLNTFYYHC